MSGSLIFALIFIIAVIVGSLFWIIFHLKQDLKYLLLAYHETSIRWAKFYENREEIKVFMKKKIRNPETRRFIEKKLDDI